MSSDRFFLFTTAKSGRRESLVEITMDRNTDTREDLLRYLSLLEEKLPVAAGFPDRIEFFRKEIRITLAQLSTLR
jgi:hypothetical protein